MPSATGQSRRSINPESLERRLPEITEEDRIHLFEDVGVDLEELPLVLDWDQGSLGAVVHGHLEGFYEGAHWSDIALDAHVSEYEKSGLG